MRITLVAVLLWFICLSAVWAGGQTTHLLVDYGSTAPYAVALRRSSDGQFMKSREVATVKGRFLEFSNLLPGTYSLECHSETLSYSNYISHAQDVVIGKGPGVQHVKIGGNGDGHAPRIVVTAKGTAVPTLSGNPDIAVARAQTLPSEGGYHHPRYLMWVFFKREGDQFVSTNTGFVPGRYRLTFFDHEERTPKDVISIVVDIPPKEQLKPAIFSVMAEVGPNDKAE